MAYLNLSYEDLASVICLAIHLANADGKIDDVETEAIIRAILDQYNVDGQGDLLKEYLNDGMNMEPSEALKRIAAFGAEEKQFTSNFFVKTICADEKLTDEEKELYFKIMEICALPDHNLGEVSNSQPKEEDEAIIPAYILAKFNGVANLRQSANTNWDLLGREMEAWMGCDGIQVVRYTKALNALTEQLNLNKRHLVFLVGKRFNREVGDNATATILYGGGQELYGDIVFALETDEGYEIEGIRSQNLLSKAFAVINEAVDGLLRAE